MSKLEKRFFRKKHRTIIKPGDSNANSILKALKKAIVKNPNGWSFNIDLVRN